MRILLVEDDAMLAEAMARALKQSAHAVERAAGGRKPTARWSRTNYDLVLLDLGLPQMDGFEVLKRLRARRANGAGADAHGARCGRGPRRGLDLGADDYLTKPFELSELEARVRALIRRSHAAPNVGHHPRDAAAGHRRAGASTATSEPVDLSARELSVVELLLLREGRVVTKQQIVDHLYGWEDNSSTSNAVEVFVYRLRRKLEPSGVDIRTVRGMGYLIEKPNAA